MLMWIATGDESAVGEEELREISLCDSKIEISLFLNVYFGLRTWFQLECLRGEETNSFGGKGSVSVGMNIPRKLLRHEKRESDTGIERDKRREDEWHLKKFPEDVVISHAFLSLSCLISLFPLLILYCTEHECHTRPEREECPLRYQWTHPLLFLCDTGAHSTSSSLLVPFPCPWIFGMNIREERESDRRRKFQERQEYSSRVEWMTVCWTHVMFLLLFFRSCPMVPHKTLTDDDDESWMNRLNSIISGRVREM